MSDKKIWSMPLYPGPYYGIAKIANGEKSIEGRVPDNENPKKDYRTMKPGDTLWFFAVDPKTGNNLHLGYIKFEVGFVHHYPSVEEMLETEGLEALLPGVESIEEGVEVYLSFPGYRERVEKYGVYAIGLGDRV